MTEYAGAKLGELVDGELTDRNEHVYRHAGYVRDPDLSECLSFAAQSHQADSAGVGQFHQSELFGACVGHAATQQATRAAENGNVSLASFLTGLTNQSIDAQQLPVLVDLLDALKRPGYLAVWMGHMDSGKTNTALLMAYDLAMAAVPEMRLVTNITSVKSDVPDDRLHVVESFSTFKQTVEFLRDRDIPTIAILDEFSSHASGYSSDASNVEEKMRQTVRKAAKTGTRLLILGHDGKDIHPTIRELAIHFIAQERIENTDEPDEYRALFYEEVEDRTPVDLQFRLDAVPETSIDYNPDEFTTWSWD